MSVYYRTYDLPWTLSTEDEKRFRKILKTTALLLLLFSIIMPLLPVPERDPNEIQEIPPRLAKLLLERQQPPPPPPKVEEPEQLEPEPERVVETTPEPVTNPDPEPEAPPVDTVEQARDTASKAGLLLFADDLADLRDNEAVASVTGDQDLTTGPGEGEAVERSLITSSVGRASGGINTASLSRGTGGGGIAGRSTTKLTSPVGGGRGGTGMGGGRSGSGGMASRSDEEIELVFDRNKGAIYALYNRALRRDPTLQGKIVLSLTITPDGRVTECTIVTSELNNPVLERKLVQRVMMFQFEDKDVSTVTRTKPIDFFPA